MKLGLLLLVSAVPAMADFVGPRNLVFTGVTGTLTSCHTDPICVSLLGQSLPASDLATINYTFSATDFDATITNTPPFFDYLNTNTETQIDFFIDSLDYGYGEETPAENVWNLSFSGFLSNDVTLAPVSFTGTFTTDVVGGVRGSYSVTGTLAVIGPLTTPEPSEFTVLLIMAIAAHRAAHRGRVRPRILGSPRA